MGRGKGGGAGGGKRVDTCNTFTDKDFFKKSDEKFTIQINARNWGGDLETKTVTRERADAHIYADEENIIFIDFGEEKAGREREKHQWFIGPCSTTEPRWPARFFVVFFGSSLPES